MKEDEYTIFSVNGLDTIVRYKIDPNKQIALLKKLKEMYETNYQEKNQKVL